MSVTIHCPHCGAAGNAPDHILGQSVRCSKCKQSFVAGGEEEPEAPDEREESDDDFDVPPAPRKGRAKAHSGGGGGFGEVLAFRTLIGPTIVVVLFWLGIVGVILFALGMIAMSFMFGVMAGLGGLVMGLIMIVIGIPVVRLSCELMLVQFRIYERLKELKGPPGQ